MKNLLFGAALFGGAMFGSAAHAAPTIFNYTGTEVSYTVTATGLYDIVAFGAQGGDGPDGHLGIGLGGMGAQIGGEWNLTAGDVLTILVGGRGGTPGNFAGGGGGGSFVALFSPSGSSPLVIAGGGGGGSSTSPNGGAGGILPHGQDSVGVGGSVSGTGGASVLSGGRAGFGSFNDSGGGGGGYSQRGFDSGAIVKGGTDFLLGGAGGAGFTGAGGFGGGGGGGFTGGGGGGGAGGGGGGGGFSSQPLFLGSGGGGGGSYLGDGVTNPILIAGFQSGDGEVVIAQVISADVPEPASLALLSAGLGLLAVARRRAASRIRSVVTGAYHGAESSGA